MGKAGLSSEAAVVGQPVVIGAGTDQALAPPQDPEVPPGAQPCNPLCCTGNTTISVTVFLFVMEAASYQLATEAAWHRMNLSISNLVGLVCVVCVCVGGGYTMRCSPRPVPHGCDCCSPNRCCPCVPWTLGVLALLGVFRITSAL